MLLVSCETEEITYALLQALKESNCLTSLVILVHGTAQKMAQTVEPLGKLAQVHAANDREHACYCDYFWQVADGGNGSSCGKGTGFSLFLSTGEIVGKWVTPCLSFPICKRGQ